MQNALKRSIKKLCERAIKRSKRLALNQKEYAEKYTKRTGHPSPSTPPTKSYAHKHFDPVYCKRNANFLAKTIWRKVQRGEYEPSPALTFSLKKPGGGSRTIMQFTIPDAALASVLNKRITIRNLKRQSANSFAYRPDRNVFDALIKLRSAVKPQRNYVLQLDFEKYFDNIPHEYLSRLLGDRNCIIAHAPERAAIEKFLVHRFADRNEYTQGQFKRRTIGTPQGSSISLVLANLASHPLDLELEAINGQFVRYADDTVVINYSYEDAIKSYDVFNTHCERSGLTINKSKSPGICILSKSEEEFRTATELKFLGYGVSLDGLFMHGSVVDRLKTKLSRLINLYLIHYIEKKPPAKIRAGKGFDWDLLGLVYEIRMVLYGGLNEQQLAAFIKEGRMLPAMRGLMGFYALLDEKGALVDLDGWLATTITQALIKRYALLGKSLRIVKRDLISGAWHDHVKFDTAKFKPDARLPSFVRGWAAARKHYYSFGLEDVEPPKYIMGYY